MVEYSLGFVKFEKYCTRLDRDWEDRQKCMLMKMYERKDYKIENYKNII